MARKEQMYTSAGNLIALGRCVNQAFLTWRLKEIIIIVDQWYQGYARSSMGLHYCVWFGRRGLEEKKSTEFMGGGCAIPIISFRATALNVLTLTRRRVHNVLLVSRSFLVSATLSTQAGPSHSLS